MSLTSELNRTGSPVSQFIRGQFPNIPQMVRAANKQAAGVEPILAPDGTASRTLGDLGTATDYRIRFNYPEMDLERTQALQAILLLDRFVSTETPLPDPTQDLYEVVPSYILHGFFNELEDFLPLARPDQGALNPSDEATLSRYCYIMAVLEEGKAFWNNPRRFDVATQGRCGVHQQAARMDTGRHRSAKCAVPGSHGRIFDPASYP